MAVFRLAVCVAVAAATTAGHLADATGAEEAAALESQACLVQSGAVLKGAADAPPMEQHEQKAQPQPAPAVALQQQKQRPAGPPKIVRAGEVAAEGLESAYPADASLPPPPQVPAAFAPGDGEQLAGDDSFGSSRANYIGDFFVEHAIPLTAGALVFGLFGMTFPIYTKQL